VGEDNYADTLRFVAEAHAPLRVTTLIRTQGGHNFSTWSSEVNPGLEWLTTHLTGPSPGG
jgi:hypothetical protein